VGVAASPGKVYEYYTAKSGSITTETAAQNIIDTIHKYYADLATGSGPRSRLT
jgi:hypothetical protein